MYDGAWQILLRAAFSKQANNNKNHTPNLKSSSSEKFQKEVWSLQFPVLSEAENRVTGLLNVLGAWKSFRLYSRDSGFRDYSLKTCWAPRCWENVVAKVAQGRGAEGQSVCLPHPWLSLSGAGPTEAGFSTCGHFHGLAAGLPCEWRTCIATSVQLWFHTEAGVNANTVFMFSASAGIFVISKNQEMETKQYNQNPASSKDLSRILGILWLSPNLLPFEI